MGGTSLSTFAFVFPSVRMSVVFVYFPVLSLLVILSTFLSLKNCFLSFILFHFFSLLSGYIFIFRSFFSVFISSCLLFSMCRIFLWSIENHKLNRVAAKLFSLMCPFSISYRTLERQKKTEKNKKSFWIVIDIVLFGAMNFF